MDEIKTLLESWKQDGFVNPDSLQLAHDAILLLVTKVEELENKITILEGEK